METEYIGQRPSFTALPNWLRGQATPLELAILWCLQSHYPNIHPSLNLLAREACLSRRAVCTVLAGMERKGWLVREQAFSECGRKAATRYRLTIWDARWALVDSAGGALVQEVHHRHSAGGALGIVQEVHGDSAPGALKEDQEKKNKKKKTYEPPLPPAAQGALRPSAVAAHPHRDRDGFLIADPGPQPAAAAEPPVMAEPPAQPQSQAAAEPPLQPLAEVQPQPQQPNPPRPLPNPSDPEAMVPVKPKARRREAGFVPTVDDVPAALLPVQRELLAFWPARNPKGKRTERAWAVMLTEAQKIQDHQQGGTEILRQQLEEGAKAIVTGPGWRSLDFKRWIQYGTKAGTPIIGSGFAGRRTTMDRVRGAMALIEQRERAAAAQQAVPGALVLAEVA